MATEAAPSTVNGTYHPHPHANPYAADHYNPSHPAATTPSALYNAPQPSNPPPAQTNEPKNEITKDEVGWYFVEQYYTTLSRSPEKLHLFYSRKSQFVFGVEAEKVPVAVGQKAIHERIKGLDFHDCKVRVLNVDSQASFDNIVVCVIGEISNKSEPSRKFVQTFILAEQPNGYYVLNDIFRYLVDEEEEFVPEEAPVEEAQAAEQAAPAPEKQAEATSQTEVEREAEIQATVQQVDQKLEEAKANGEEKPTVEKQQTEEKAEAPTANTDASATTAPAEQETAQPEKPKEPEPTPAVASPAKAATPAAEKENVPPPKPAVPMSWASIASVASGRPAATAAAAVATPATASAPAATVAQPKTAPASSAPQQPAAPAATEVEKVPSQSSSSNGEWQTADHGKRQSRQQVAEDNTLAYVKNVNEKVDASLLKQTLSRFGKLKYFNVNRQQGCAFVEFSDPAGYKAAVAANPHQIGSERVTVEERRQRGGYGGTGGGYAPRGGAGRGRGDRTGNQGRGGFQKDAGRYQPRGRGGNVTPRGGRGQPQAS
ncbi:hypothetical protein VTO42DRAFT_7430 [Malbranchea cinnamomea]